jgi:hypothetical protein
MGKLDSSDTGVAFTIEQGGDFVFGDPCYSFQDHGQWMELLHSCNFLKDSPVARTKDAWFVAASTSFGDGVYTDIVSGTSLGVDSGTLGLVPLAPGAGVPDLTMRVSVPSGSTFRCSEDGEFTVLDPQGDALVSVKT